MPSARAGTFGTRVSAARVSFARRSFLKPLRLSSGTITEITEARAEVTVVVDGGREAVGHGSVYLSDLWAWPDPSVTPEARDSAMRAFTASLANQLSSVVGDDAPHPLEAGLRLHAAALRQSGVMPPLARLVCLSPLDAALHDAVGHATGRSAFDFYDYDAHVPSADALFPAVGATAAVRALLAQPPIETLDATLVVGKGDDLADLEFFLTERHYRSFKLKVGGTNPEEDASRVSNVYRWALRCGVDAPRLSVDANCAAPHATTVGAFLDLLEAKDASAYRALEAVEQPTGRDIRANCYNWRSIARRKPILLDEGLTDFDTLISAGSQGWNGMAVKTCRGHSFSLVTAAWAHQREWTLAMMDLTNPGYAAIHSALFASRLPGVTAIEMNAPQFTPAANAEWLPRLSRLLEPTDGVHCLLAPPPIGLGTQL